MTLASISMTALESILSLILSVLIGMIGLIRVLFWVVASRRYSIDYA